MRRVVDGLGLGQVPFVTSSFEAGIFLRTAAVAPERIGRAAMVVPSGHRQRPSVVHDAAPDAAGAGGCGADPGRHLPARSTMAAINERILQFLHS